MVFRLISFILNLLTSLKFNEGILPLDLKTFNSKAHTIYAVSDKEANYLFKEKEILGENQENEYRYS